MNVLYLIDPHSIHDLNWITNISADSKWYVHRECHKPNPNLSSKVKLITSIPDFSIRHPLQTIMALWRLSIIIKNNNIDVFHIMYAEPNALWALVKVISNVKCVITTRGTDILQTIPGHFSLASFQNIYVRRLYSAAFRVTDACTCTSLEQVSSIKRLFGNIKTKLVRTGVDIDAIDSLKGGVLPSQLQDSPYILFPRSMKPLYNHELALNAISMLPKEIRNAFRFVFVDSTSIDKLYVEKVKSLMRNIDAIFEFMPRLTQEQLIPIYFNSRLVVHTPISDGSPVSALEAMYCQVPVLLPKLAYDNTLFSNCLFYSPNDVVSLVDKITEEISHPNIEKVMKSYISVKNMANRDLEMRKLQQLYITLVYG
ncbi:MAG TPA: hypothetical protein DDY13_03790 [Cytophagales bacterium]|jgi:glycosyltransferase involved in cell wall biosynthesis|nr:hypothetical protein [Cytophagales bacterium]